MDIAHLQQRLADSTPAVEFAPGLTAAEFSRIEAQHGFRFPPDLRAFLTVGLPVSEHWVDWRDDRHSDIDMRMIWPHEGLLAEVGVGRFWREAWGKQPDNRSERVAIVRDLLSNAPIMLPIYAHRYIPAEPCEAGNPIYWVYRSQVIRYGENLKHYFRVDFADIFDRDERAEHFPVNHRNIPFWSELLS